MPEHTTPGPSDLNSIRTSLHDLANEMNGLREDVSALRSDVGDLRSDVRLLRERQHRQDRELWSSEGLSRSQEITAQLRTVSLQIKGVWAVLVGVTGFITAWALSHMHGGVS